MRNILLESYESSGIIKESLPLPLALPGAEGVIGGGGRDGRKMKSVEEKEWLRKELEEEEEMRNREKRLREVK